MTAEENGSNLPSMAGCKGGTIQLRDLQSFVDEEYRKAPEEAMRLYDGKTVEEAFPHVLKSQLQSRLNQLEAGRQAML